MLKSIVNFSILFLLINAHAIASQPEELKRKSVSADERIGNHIAVRDSLGTLLPWTSWENALQLEMNWYLNCPVEHGYPAFVWMTFMDGNYKPDPNRKDFIPATQNGMGIISYLKYYAYDGKRNQDFLKIARLMGDYLVKECNTPDSGAYPKFTRSTGIRAMFPQPADCGTQGDQPYDIQPDKGGIAGYALLQLFKEVKDSIYFRQAKHNAELLVKWMESGDSTHSPLPYRADFRTGAKRGDVSANMVYVLRLLDDLIESGCRQFKPKRDQLWKWIHDFQIPNAAGNGLLWVQFFEDHHGTDNRNAWAPLNLARYLLEKQDMLDSQWAEHSKMLIDFVNRNFTSIRSGVTICGEQDYDRNPWGGIISTYGAVLAMYCRATGSAEYKNLAYQALNYSLYATDSDGCPGEQASYPCRGGWQEDAHTDKIHNFLDAIKAYPQWAK